VISTLVTDDDYQVAEINAEYVRRVEGFEVAGVAHSAQQTMAALARHRPDLLLLDLYLPDRTGLDVLRALQQRPGPRTDVIVITAARDVTSVRQAMQCGAVHYLVKPFGFAAIRERLESYRQMRGKLGGLDEAGQDDIDDLYALLRPGSVRSLPKGLSAPTLRIVTAALESATEDLTASELAGRIGLGRATAARYLGYLHETGRVELKPDYGGPGRPEHRYRWSR
jgi:two-component system CitB family response regulator